MVSDIYYGKIKASKLNTWTTNDDPYEILEDNVPISVSGWDFLSKANDIFRDKTQVDWGSFAYKANVQELRKLEEQMNCEVPGIEFLNDNVDYGIIFIEEV